MKQAQGSLATTETVVQRFGKRLAVGLAAAFSVQKIAAFGQASVKAAAEADASWNRLAGTLKNAGVEFTQVRYRIERAAKAMEEATTVSDEGFAETLQTLTRITGDYNASLAEVETVANLAAGAQIDLQTAAQLVGKVMVGETGTLKRYGIVVEEGADAMQLLRDRFKGMAQNEANTLHGKVIQLANAWDNFKEAIGNALIDASNGPSILDQLTGAIRGATTWIDEHAGAIKFWGDQIGYVIKGMTKQLELMEKFDRAVGFGFLWGNKAAPTLPAAQAVGPNRAPGSRTPRGPREVSEEAAAAAEAAAKTLAEATKVWGETIAAHLAAVREEVEAASDAMLEHLRGLDEHFRGVAGVQAPGLNLKQVKIKAHQATNFGDGGGGIKDFAGQFFGGLKDQVAGIAASFGPLALAAAALAPVFEGLMAVLGPIFQTLAEPLRTIGVLFGTVIAPILKQLEPVLKAFATAISYVIQGWGMLIKAIGDAINFLVPFANPANNIVKFGQNMIDAARAARAHADATDAATDAIKDFADTLTTNLPQGFRVLSLAEAQFRSAIPIASTAPRGITDNRTTTINIIESATGDGTFKRRVVEVIRSTFKEDGLLFEGDPSAFLPARS